VPLKRGDVVLTFVPNVGSTGGKVRPAPVAQTDRNNNRLNETIIASITSNTSRVFEPAQLLVDTSTAVGFATGLLHNSSVRCERLHVIPQTDVRRITGSFSAALMLRIDDCLKSALGIS